MIPWYTNIAASTLSNVSKFYNMRNHFSTLNSESKMAPKCRKETTKTSILASTTGQITTLGGLVDLQYLFQHPHPANVHSFPAPG